MEGKHIVGVVSILVVGAIVVTVLAMHPWRGDDRRDFRDHHEEQTVAQQQQAAADAQAAVQNAAPAPAAPTVVVPGAYDANGQALTTVFPTEDTVEVYEDNVWVPARITQREQGRVYVEYDGKGGKRNDWVTPTRVRSVHR